MNESNSPEFGGETNIINLSESIEVATHWWDNLSPLANAAYDDLMLNEDYWSYPNHYYFTRLPVWHPLGHA